MNTLSIMLYLSDVLVNLQTTIGILASIGGVALGFVASVHALETGRLLPKFFVFLPILVFMGVLSCLVPTKQTIHLIIASELAEEIVVSEDGRETYNLLKNKVHSLLKEE